MNIYIICNCGVCRGLRGIMNASQDIAILEDGIIFYPQTREDYGIIKVV